MTIQEFDAYLADVAWFWPGVVLSLILSLVIGPSVARALRARTSNGFLLTFAVGLVVSATLTPSLEAIRVGAIGRGSCDVGRVGPATFAEIVAFGDPTFNILLFIPLGIACGLVPWSLRKSALLFGASALPIAIEAVQSLATGLDRACQTADVSDNLTGLVLGLATGLLARAVGALARGGHDRRGGATVREDTTPGPSDAAGPRRP